MYVHNFSSYLTQSFVLWTKPHFFFQRLVDFADVQYKKVQPGINLWMSFLSCCTDLEWDLYKNVFGQHLVQDIVSEEVAKFLQNKSPDQPLVLSFHGSSGTGKTLVSSMLGNHLYGSAMSSPFVHQFVPTLHFPSLKRVKRYKVS